MRTLKMFVFMLAAVVLTGCSATPYKKLELDENQVLGAGPGFDNWKETVPGSDEFGRIDASFRRMLTPLEGEVALRNAALLCPDLANELLMPENFEHLAVVHWRPVARSLTNYREFREGERYVLVPSELRAEAQKLESRTRVEVRLPTKKCGGVMMMTGLPVNGS